MPTHAGYRREGNIGVVTLHNPPQNRLSAVMTEELEAAVNEASAQRVRALLFHGEGEHFCLGADIAEWPRYSVADLRSFVSRVNHVFQRIEELPIPTIAAVRGGCAGGGFELALHCDLILAAPDATFRFPEATLAIPPLAGGVQRLGERLGRALATRLVFFTEALDATRAEELGIVARLLTEDDPVREALGIAATFADGPTLAYQSTKALLRATAQGGVGVADRLLLDLADLTLNSADFGKAVPSAVDAYVRGVPRPVLSYEGN